MKLVQDNILKGIKCGSEPFWDVLFPTNLGVQVSEVQFKGLAFQGNACFRSSNRKLMQLPGSEI